MWWRRRKARRRAAEARESDHGRVGTHRLADGDTVPYSNGRTWRDYLRTEEFPVINRTNLFTPAQEQRGGRRRWV
jgi:hypothetical protein